MKCPSCQHEYLDSDQFCRECGSKLPLACPECGADLFANDKFCGKCGHKLTEPKEPPPIDYSEPQSYTPKFLALRKGSPIKRLVK